MNALDLLKHSISNSGIDSVETIGISSPKANNLDCDCVNSDCSTGGYEY